MTRRLLDTEDLVGIGEIAERTGVSSAAVTNWQTRHTEFPEPLVKLSCGPVFEWKEVYAWLVATGRESK